MKVGQSRAEFQIGRGQLRAAASSFGSASGVAGNYSGQRRLLARQMASRWQGMRASVRRRSLRNHEQLEDSKALQSVVSHQETSTLGSLCRQFQRRLPLRAVNLNLGAGPSWKRLETPEPGQQDLQGAVRSAKSALGAMSQRIQESCQSGTKWLVETHVKARRGKRGAQKDSSLPAHSLTQKSSRLSRATSAHSAMDSWERQHHYRSVQMGLRTPQLRRSRREAAFRSPYSSTEPLCSPRQSDGDLEPVGAGIQHLQKLSQELDEAIMAEDSDMTVFLIHD
ncbi:protein PIMREG isoform X2 [Nycticebus coucang]|uniref:protein PIMREG isoform X2 n=1 Tax=Nycticebus coucang TaxID=9470 RepID=UPI00234E33CE|nr:protein PIMREG isoform X2 [Nycticebus coucang]XP_053425365.1 protein PIMREG isoform X2 [Nycticebus coucang]XP_053425366.1 protein PIMREG isoform X2 [Nycticebus coucang]